ncbi:MAG: hypothetical protein DKT66_17200 [Candidatus Melainabacteria bacterium]|nr:cbb3-type cytochrome oxidase assembly protein CcoS [Candidatus Obscuribacterales bacterium]PZM80968.1 MAG: hypothetical protein DKT66_17200 [Candidatus Melainabacteria bacterium]
MCPNCILNQQGLSSGIYVAFFICGLFFVMAIGAILWAFKNGEFENMEDVKFDMLDDGDDNTTGQKALAAVEKIRLSASTANK